MTANVNMISSGERALLLCGGFLLVTAIIHLFVSLSPLRANGRCIFQRPRPGLLRLLFGELSPMLSFICGLFFTALTTAAWYALENLRGVPAFLLPGPVPGLLVTFFLVVTSLRRLRGHCGAKVVFSALVSLLLLIAGGLILLIYEGT